MFDNSLLDSSVSKKRKGRKVYFLMTAILWGSALIGLIIYGIYSFDARLNEQFEQLTRLAAPPPPPAPAPVQKVEQAKVQKPVKIESNIPTKVAPRTIEIPKLKPPLIPTNNVSFNVPGGTSEGGDSRGVPSGLPGGVPLGDPGALPSPPPPIKIEEPKKFEPKPTILRRSGGVLQGAAVKRVHPAYPPLAKTARISGSVTVEVTIDEEGNVISAHAISGHALLKKACEDSALKWKFNPTKLSGEPVKVIGTITFNFTL